MKSHQMNSLDWIINHMFILWSEESRSLLLSILEAPGNFSSWGSCGRGVGKIGEQSFYIEKFGGDHEQQLIQIKKIDEQNFVKVSSIKIIEIYNLCFDYILIEQMNILKKLSAPLHHKLKYNQSVLLKEIKPIKFVNQSVELTFKGPQQMYWQIHQFKKYQQIPIYLKYFYKFPYRGVNRKTNYQLYLQYINIIQANLVKSRLKKIRVQKAQKQQQTQQKQSAKGTQKAQNEKEKEQTQNSTKYLWTFIFLVAFSLIALQLYEKNMMHITNKNELLKSAVNQEQVIKKILEGLNKIKITQLKNSNCSYQLTFIYEHTPPETFFYSGDLNNLLAMIQKHHPNKIERVKVEFSHPQYTFGNAAEDVFSFMFVFLGIFISYYIFKRVSPDTLLSKLSNKKSYKIEGLRDIKVKFADVAGMEQAKKQITEFVDFLKQGQKFRDMGAKIPKGALLTGPPGTGKTMLAKACAGQAGVTFFYISGSEFVELFVGVGASKVRELFSRARMEAPSIIFIDQIDAIGKKRETSRNQQKDSTLNQMLVEMDGFSSHQTVIVLAATNRKDTLDSALTRPGRFDRIVEVNLPDIKARQEIFKVHLKPLKIDPNTKLEDIAKRLAELSPGFSGADIANLCNQAAIIATRRQKSYIEEKDFQDASQRITAGYEKKGLVNPKTKKRVAFHQAGHAVCGWFLKGGDPLVKLTIIPRSKGALGYAQYLPKSSYIKTRSDLIDQIAIMMGGLTSEEIHFGQLSSGSSDDLQKVYRLSRQMIASYGMGKSTYNVTLDEQSYIKRQSQQLSKLMDQQMMILVQEGQKRCIQILVKNKEALTQLAETLLQKETINGEDIKRILGERPTFT